MRWFWFAFFRLLPVAVVVAVTLGMRAMLSPWYAFAATTAAGATFAALGALVLRATRVGEVTWRNRLAGFLLPWGYFLGRGQLPGIVLGCVLVWAALAGAVLLGHGVQPAAPIGAQPANVAPGLSWWLLIAWIVDGACLIYMIGMLRKHFVPASQVTRTQGKLVLLLVAMLAGSIALHLGGNGGLALTVAGGPTLLVGGGYGLFLGFILVFGRNMRWN